VSPNLVGAAAAQLPFASTLCGACKDICPVNIDIPRILLHLRWKEATRSDLPKWPAPAARARAGARQFARLARHPSTIRLLGKIGAIALKPFARDGWIKRMPLPFSNWTGIRDFPRPRPRRSKISAHED